MRDQTSHAAQRANQKWRQRAGKAQKLSPSSAHDASESSQKSDLSPASSKKSPVADDPIIDRMFYDWVVDDSSQTGQTVLGFLRRMYETPGETLARSVSALAHANFARRFHSSEAEQIAIEEYSKALHLLQSEMRGPLELITDQTIAATTILSFYEVNHHT